MIHPLELLGSIKPFQPVDVMAQRGALAKLQEAHTQDLLGQQQIAAGQDAATSRQAALQKQGAVEAVFQNADFSTGKIDDKSLAQLYRLDPDHADKIVQSGLASENIKSERDLHLAQAANIPLDNTRADQQLAETISNNDKMRQQAKDNADREANKPVAVPEHSSLVSPAGKVLLQGTPTPIPPRNIDPNSPEGIAAAVKKSQGGYHAEPTVVVKTVDENGNPVTQIVPKTAGTQIAGAPTAQEQNRRNQATTVINEADRIIAMIDANPNAVGPILGRIARGETVIGNVDPNTKALGTALGSFVALQPILHGFRGGGQTVEHFTSVLGDQRLNGPALKASLAQVKALAMDIKTGKVQTEGAPAATKAPAGVDPAVWNVMTPQERALWK